MIQAAAASLKAAAEQKEENENAAENPEDAGYFDNVNQTLIRYCTSIGPMNREDVLNYNPLRKTTSQQMLILLTCLSILIFRK